MKAIFYVLWSYDRTNINGNAASSSNLHNIGAKSRISLITIAFKQAHLQDQLVALSIGLSKDVCRAYQHKAAIVASKYLLLALRAMFLLLPSHFVPHVFRHLYRQYEITSY